MHYARGSNDIAKMFFRRGYAGTDFQIQNRLGQKTRIGSIRFDLPVISGVDSLCRGNIVLNKNQEHQKKARRNFHTSSWVRINSLPYNLLITLKTSRLPDHIFPLFL